MDRADSDAEHTPPSTRLAKPERIDGASGILLTRGQHSITEGGAPD